MKKLLLLLLLFATISYGQIRVSPDGHSLVYKDGAPFFWLGDTGWELLNRLTKEEIRFYLENRRQKGFNVIQAVIFAENMVPNRYGDVPFINNDPAKPNEKYFRFVDWMIQLANTKKIFVGLLPTWGSHISLFSVKNAYAYGLFLGKRYRTYTNIVWIMGGDRPAFVDTMDWRPVWRSMIKGIRDAGHTALITYHPAGESSSSFFWANENTLDFNMLQSGHRVQDLPVAAWIKRDYHLQPAKPVLDAEPNYEDHPINWRAENGYFRAYDVRKQLYRSVFSGACGVTYGHHAVWQFYSPREKAINAPDRYWTAALDRPAAYQAGYLKKLVAGLERIPDETIAPGLPAIRDGGNSYAMVYLPVGKKITITRRYKTAEWFNPRTGEIKKIEAAGLVYTAPTAEDWVLILGNGL